MKKILKSSIATLLLLTMLVGMMPAVSVFAAADTSPVGELLDSYTSNDSVFTLSTDSCIFVVANQEPSGDLLQTVQLIQRQFAADGKPSASVMPIVWGPAEWAQDGDIVILLDAESGIAAEAYRLDVTTTAQITVSDVDGLIYGANMLLKHLRYAGSNSINGFSAADAPDTVQRAVSLDCGRKYYTKDWICNFIREMSWMGYNTLQFHFSDDSGFRFDLWDEAYYKGQFQPENDFSWICGSNYTSWTLSAYKNDADKGKYLTTAEVIEILETAKEYHIEVIPCFDSPSHLDYLTWTFEQHYDSNTSYSFYSTYDQKTYYAADVNGVINYTNSRDWTTDLRWPYYSAVNVKGALAKAFIFELYIDIANFFKEYSASTDMSVGADEVQLSTANISSNYSYAWGYADFVDYINELNALLNDMGYTMRMYNDFLGSTSNNASSYTYAENIEVQYWDSPFNPSSSTASNHTEPVSYYVNEGRIIYNCIQTNTYYALRKTSAGSDARSVRNRQWTFYHANEEDIYNEWYSADISEHGDYSEDVADVPEANLGGAYFLIWCDYACVSTEKEIWNGCYDTDGSGEYYSLRDRMDSNIIKMWNWDINDSVTFEEFAAVRDKLGSFPGLGTTTDSCSEPTVLPAATEPVSGYAGGCESYNAYGTVKTTGSTQVMTLPCSAEVEASSTVLESAQSGADYTAIMLYKNTAGELWYKVRTQSGVNGYIKATDTTYVADLTDDITITNADAPSAHVKGAIFYVCGDIASRYNTLTSAAVYIHSGFDVNGEVVTGASDTVTGNAYSLMYSDVDNNTAFGDVPLGNNTYVISADYSSYHADGDSLVASTGSVNLLVQYFVVISASVDQSSCVHSYTSEVISEATCTTAGAVVYGCATCGHVYEDVSPIIGHDYTEEIIPATCVDKEKVRYICTACGDSYVDYASDSWSDWQDTKPEGLDDSMIESKTQYSYSDKETVTSYETALDGYTQTGSSWVTANTGTIQYVNSWPSGFYTSHSLYSAYNNKANKVSAYETDTTKRVINSDALSGYLYYHWCYYNSYYSVASKSGSYTTFHAYYSTTAPSNYACDTSDWSYKTSHTSTCTNSNWYFVAYVYSQNYTDYNKLFTYERWTDYSDWSDEVYTASDTRQVQTRTVYRYIDTPFGDHAWSDGVCTVCGTACEHTYQNNVCTICGMSKPVMDYYLFGYINGADYADKDDSANLGEYKFVDGSLVVFFTDDSYVGVKASNNTDWYMTDGWQGYVSSVTLYNTKNITTSDKLFIPGNTEVTFTLVDNGDDTYTLSYVALECPHDSHTTEGTCTQCGEAVEHSYSTDGLCVCGLVCAHDMVDGLCTICGKSCDHAYQSNICTICGQEKPVMDYYLFGWINGANYACEEDYANLGEYKFVDGQVVVRFNSDSYVAVKASDNANWYMTAGWQGQVNSATLYNTKSLSNADKLYVPGGKMVTFTLVDNGDDTYVLSYEAACLHESHSTEGICDACGESVLHTYQNNICTVCGYEKPVQDMYLFGWINGADYADKEDSANLGKYKFKNGTLVVYFNQDSYVGVKTADNLGWYMTDGYQEGATSVTLVNADTILTEDKLFIPGNQMVTLTLVDNGDDTYNLSYVAQDCPHEIHVLHGQCVMCLAIVEHEFVNGVCDCGKTCTHTYENGVCTVCGIVCDHQWNEGVCSVCALICVHEWNQGVCDCCGISCAHTWIDGQCSICGLICDHSWQDGVCSVCGMLCVHTYQNNICTNCGIQKPATDYYLSGQINGQDYAWGEDAANLGDYLFVDGKLVVTFLQDSYVALKAGDNAGWYMTDGDQGQVTSVILYNASAIENGGLLYVPGCMEITFTLVDNGDDTLTLSYEATPCTHAEHDVDGSCVFCGTVVEHNCEGTVTAPTCTEGGYTTYACACGYSYISDEVAALGHSYEGVVTAPTCTDAGYTTYTCSCGDSYVADEVAVLDHSYVNGICNACGVAADVNIQLLYPTLLTEDEILMSVYFTLDIQGFDSDRIGMLTWSAMPELVDVASAEQMISGATYDSESDYYSVRTNPISAKNLGDEIYFCVYVQMDDGSYKYGNVVSYSPATYAYNQLADATASVEMKQFVVAMLNYGAAAQVYFDYKTDAQVNANLTDEQIAMVAPYDSNMVQSIAAAPADKQGVFLANGGFAVKRPTVSLEGAFRINYYFVLSEGALPVGDVMFYYWNQADYESSDILSEQNATGSMAMVANDDAYEASVSGIAAKDLDSAVYVAAVYTDADGNAYSTGILHYSLGVYCANQAANGSDVMQPMAAATAVYGYYAKTYFAAIA